MPPDGARHKHRGHRDDEDDRDLYRHQHPASAGAGGGRPSRYSSPSRPHRDGDEVPGGVTTWGTAAAVSGILQSLVWVGMSMAAALLYRDIIPAPEQPAKDGRWDDFTALLTNLYFRETGVYLVAEQGLTSSRNVYRFMAATLVVAVLWLVTSSVMLRQMRLGGFRSVRGSAVAWSVTVVVVTVLDVMIAAAMVHDLVALSDWDQGAESFPGDVGTLKLCPGIMLVVALRAGVLLVANVVCMLVILYRLGKVRRASDGHRDSVGDSDSPSATKREGPIDGFLYRTDDYRNGHSLGVQNPVFVPDEAAAPAPAPAASVLRPWASFKPQEQQQQQQQQQQAPGYHQGPRSMDDRTRATQDDLDDVSHLSWMEEPDKHVEIRARPAARPAAPVHHRFGFTEPVHNGRGEVEATRPPSYRSSVSNLPAPGAAPGSDSMLPRVRIKPSAPRFPVIPPPDYSPPVRRATVKRGPRTLPKPSVRMIPVPIPQPPALAALWAGAAGAKCAAGAGMGAGPPRTHTHSTYADQVVAFEGYESGEDEA